MNIDEKLIFDEEQAVTTAKVSANIIDLGSITEGGKGAPKFINIMVQTAFTTSTHTLAVNLITSSVTDPIAANILAGVLPATAASSLVTPGLVAKLPLPSVGLQRYVGLSYVTNTAVAAGKVTAFLSID